MSSLHFEYNPNDDDEDETSSDYSEVAERWLSLQAAVHTKGLQSSTQTKGSQSSNHRDNRGSFSFGKSGGSSSSAASSSCNKKKTKKKSSSSSKKQSSTPIIDKLPSGMCSANNNKHSDDDEKSLDLDMAFAPETATAAETSSTTSAAAKNKFHSSSDSLGSFASTTKNKIMSHLSSSLSSLSKTITKQKKPNGKSTPGAKRKRTKTPFLVLGVDHEHEDDTSCNPEDDVTTPLGDSFSSFWTNTAPPQLQQQTKLEALQRSQAKVEEVLEEQRARNRECAHAIRIHRDRAKARFASDNQTGAVLSFKKVKKLQLEQTNRNATIRYLQSLCDSLKSQQETQSSGSSSWGDIQLPSLAPPELDDMDSLEAMFRSSCNMDSKRNNNTTVSSASSLELEIQGQIDCILHMEMESTDMDHWTNDELLDELAEMTCVLSLASTAHSIRPGTVEL